jgi:hypothetical protein
VIQDARREEVPVARDVSLVLLVKVGPTRTSRTHACKPPPPQWMRARCVATQDYHFSPCVAAISLWSGTPLISPAFGVKPKPKPPQAPTSPGQSGEKDSEEPEEEAKPKKKVVEDTYNTKGTPIPG